MFTLHIALFVGIKTREIMRKTISKLSIQELLTRLKHRGRKTPMCLRKKKIFVDYGDRFNSEKCYLEMFL